MGSEDICNTGLLLGLGYDEVAEKRLQSKNNQQQNLFCFEFDQSSPKEGLETCLTLSLTSNMIKKKNKADDVSQVVRQSSSQSTVTSFSNPNHDITSMKREKDVGSDCFEVERLFMRGNDEDDEGGAKKKLRLTKEQSALLEDSFKEHNTLNPVYTLCYFFQIRGIMNPSNIYISYLGFMNL